MKRNYVEELIGDFGEVFRHILPGVLVLGAAYERHPYWFGPIGPSPTTEQLLVLTVLALALGNVAYFANRYGVFHILEGIAFCCGARRCGAWLRDWLLKLEYPKAVGKEMLRFYDYDRQKVYDLIRFRNAAAVYLLIAAEAGLFACCDGNGGLKEDRTLILIVSSLCLISSFWLYTINRVILRNILPN